MTWTTLQLRISAGAAHFREDDELVRQSMGTSWHEVWSRRTIRGRSDHGRQLSLQELIVADGFNTGFGDIPVDAWSEMVDRMCDTFGLNSGDSLFDVGCGAGAFLYPAGQRGIDVGGVDSSFSQIEVARRAIPSGSFDIVEANKMSITPSADVVLSFSVFQYFPSLDYARQVVERMCRKATRAVAILDVPNLDTAEHALEDRQAAVGGAAAYAERYEGLEHLSFSKRWIETILEEEGLVDVSIGPQEIRGYQNGKHRFNAWAWLPGDR